MSSFTLKSRRNKMKAIILAAGRSERLKSLTDDKPKCLLKLSDETILDYQIRSLLSCGVSHVLIVIGYHGEKIEKHIQELDAETIHTVKNPLYDRTDNAYSLALALEETNPQLEPIVVLDGDIGFDYSLLFDLVNSKYANTLVADNVKKIEPEDSKVLVQDGFAKAIGKNVKGNTVYTSMIKMSNSFLERFILEVGKPQYKTKWYSEPLNELMALFPKEVSVLFTNGRLRFEIDTYSGYIQAKDLYSRMNKVSGRKSS